MQLKELFIIIKIDIFSSHLWVIVSVKYGQSKVQMKAFNFKMLRKSTFDKAPKWYRLQLEWF